MLRALLRCVGVEVWRAVVVVGEALLVRLAVMGWALVRDFAEVLLLLERLFGLLLHTVFRFGLCLCSTGLRGVL